MGYENQDFEACTLSLFLVGRRDGKITNVELWSEKSEVGSALQEESENFHVNYGQAN